MSLATRLIALAQAVGADIKTLNTKTAGMVTSAVYNNPTTPSVVSINVPANTWTVLPVPGTLTFTKSDGVLDDFTRNADGSLTINKDGVYTLAATAGSFSGVFPGAAPATLDMRFVLTAAAKVGLPDSTDPQIACQRDLAPNGEYAIRTLNAEFSAVAGQRIGCLTYHSASSAANLGVMVFGVARTGSGIQGPPGPAVAGATTTLEVWRRVGATGQPAFQNSWTNFGGTSTPLAFRKDAFGKVRIRGTLKGGASNTVIFTLPVGYRPPTDIVYAVPTASTVSMTYVAISASTGDFSVGTVGTTAQATYVDTVEFDTDTITDLTVLASGVTSPAVALDPFHTVGAVGEPAFTNGAGTVSGYSVRYRKDPFGKVAFSGVVSVAAGSGDHIVFTLPEAYRPAGNDRNFICTSNNNVPVSVWVNTNGDVHAPKGVTYIYLDDVEFDTESVNTFSILAQTGTTDPVWFTGTSAPSVSIGKLGDFYLNTSTGAVYLRGVAAWTISALQKANWAPQYLTSLPTAGLTDGQEVFFQTTAMAALGIVWHLRYRAGSSSTYKWEFVGGSPWTVSLGGPGGTTPGIESTSTSASFVDLTTVGPAIALPLAGDYLVDFGVTCRAAAVGIGAYTAPTATGHAANAVEAAYTEAAAVNTFADARRQGIPLTGISGTLKLQYKVSTSPTGSVGFFSRDLSIRPIRVTG